jgi:hypothetical protein
MDFSFARSLLVVISFSPWIVITYLFVTRTVEVLSPNDQQVILSYIDWFGIIYSVFLAWALVSAWSQFEAVDRGFDKELNILATLLTKANFTEVANKRKKSRLKKFRYDIRELIIKYVQHVLDNYDLEHSFSEKRRRGDYFLENLGLQISSLSGEKVVPEPFVYELFGSLNEMISVRGKRISDLKPHASGVIRLMAVVISAIWLLCFLGLVIDYALVAIILIGGVTFVIIMVLFILVDLSDPFEGIWKIRLDEWNEFLETLDLDKIPN